MLFRRKAKQKPSGGPITNKRTRLVYKDKRGNAYYELANAQEYSVARVIAAQAAIRRARYNLTKEELDRLIKEACQVATGVGDPEALSKIFSILREIHDRAQMAGEEMTLLELASVYYLMAGEAEEVYGPAWQERKIDLWREDDEARAFFLRLAYASMTNYRPTYVPDIVTYLAQNTTKKRP